MNVSEVTNLTKNAVTQPPQELISQIDATIRQRAELGHTSISIVNRSLYIKYHIHAPVSATVLREIGLHYLREGFTVTDGMTNSIDNDRWIDINKLNHIKIEWPSS